MDTSRAEAAGARFIAFFDELKGAFFERDDVLRQVGLALLAREHVLLTGPPGTAKSQLAHAVFGRIVCEQTGRASLYSRQITESTVHTDLIGPIDFKQLTETGRTEHFTDEGMLGAAHAFLDEVFDGRDMLLRTALNVLQERELKQGTKVTPGQIEVALMTTNRYIADVLEQARETLLAFIDRVAFISFVPRGFADGTNMKRVLRRHVGKAGSASLDALLTIQDVDALQALVDEVHVSTAMCDGLAELLERLDTEIASAVRADPKFVPTRYLSTRTAVRSGRILRALCVEDWLKREGKRDLQVLPRDLEGLRLHLLLSGPRPGELKRLIARETDPIERRQLETVRTEREVFDRCLASLSKIRVPKHIPVRRDQAESTPETKKKKGKAKKGKGEPADPFAEVRQALGSDDIGTLVGAMQELQTAVREGGDRAEEALELLHRALGALERTTTHAALRTTDADELPQGIDALVEVATSLPDDSMSLHEVARWLRRRATDAIDELARLSFGGEAADLAQVAATADEAERYGARRIAMLERLRALRRRAEGADAPASPDETWQNAVSVVEDDIATHWDAALCTIIAAILHTDATVPLSDVLRTLAPELDRLDTQAAQLTAVAGRPSALERKALGARLSDLVGALMSRVELVDRRKMHEEVEVVLTILRKAGVEETVARADWLRWSAEALVRASPGREGTPNTFDLAGYRALRKDEERIPMVYALAEVALRLDPPDGGEASARPGLAAVAELVADLPEELRRELAELDLARIGRSVSYLQGWWDQLCEGEEGAEERLDAVVKARLFNVLWDEAALARFTLELQLVVDVLPHAEPDAQRIRERVAHLDDGTRRGALALLRERTNHAWEKAMARARS